MGEVQKIQTYLEANPMEDYEAAAMEKGLDVCRNLVQAWKDMLEVAEDKEGIRWGHFTCKLTLLAGNSSSRANTGSDAGTGPYARPCLTTSTAERQSIALLIK